MACIRGGYYRRELTGALPRAFSIPVLLFSCCTIFLPPPTKTRRCPFSESIPRDECGWSTCRATFLREQAECSTVFVALPTGKTIIVIARPDELVREFRARVTRRAATLVSKTAVWIHDCYLRLASRNMRDDEKMGTYVRAGDHHVDVYLMGRLRGGCWMFSFAIICTLTLAAVTSVCTCGTSMIAFPILLPWLFILPWFCL